MSSAFYDMSLRGSLLHRTSVVLPRFHNPYICAAAESSSGTTTDLHEIVKGWKKHEEASHSRWTVGAAPTNPSRTRGRPVAPRGEAPSGCEGLKAQKLRCSGNERTATKLHRYMDPNANVHEFKSPAFNWSNRLTTQLLRDGRIREQGNGDTCKMESTGRGMGKATGYHLSE